MKYQIRKGCPETNSSSMNSIIVTKKNENVRMTQEEIRGEFYLDEDWYKQRHKNDYEEIVKIDPWDNNYGCSPFTILSSFSDKLSYAIAEYCGENYRIASYVKAENVFDEVFKPLLIKLIGCDDVEWDKWDDRRFIIYSNSGDYFDEAEEVDYSELLLIGSDEINSIKKEDRIDDIYKNISKDGRKIEEAWFEVPDFGSIDHQSSGLLRGFLRDKNISLEDYLVRKDVVVIIDGDEYCELDNLIGCGLIREDSIVVRYPRRGPYDVCEENKDEGTD